MLEHVLVLLSSYNGERYIEEQIETILAQEDVIVKLLVRDDGSSDRTPQILERYKKEGKLDYYIGNNIGWRRSFMQLIQDAPESDFYAFADQDDHWLPKKLRKAIDYLDALPSGPKLYNCNSSIWKEGKILGKVCSNNHKFNKYSSFINPMGQGCTQVFNHDFINIVKGRIPKIEVAHDAWFARLSILLGAYCYDYNSYVLYRQHNNNQLGADITVRDKIVRRIEKYIKLKRTHYLDLIAKEMLSCYADMMDEEGYHICYTLANYRNNINCYLKVLLSPKYKCDNLLTTLGFKYRAFMKSI